MRYKRKNKDAKLRLLAGVALFSACTRRELERIASLVDEIQVEEGRVLTEEGRPGAEFFVVAEGRASARRGGRKVASLESGSFFGETALLDQGPRSATVTAETDMQLLVVGSRGFSSLIEEAPSVARGILRGMAERLRGTERSPTL